MIENRAVLRSSVRCLYIQREAQLLHLISDHGGSAVRAKVALLALLGRRHIFGEKTSEFKRKCNDDRKILKTCGAELLAVVEKDRLLLLLSCGLNLLSKLPFPWHEEWRSMLEGGGAPIGDGLLVVRLKVAVEWEEEIAVHAHSAAATTA